MYFLSLFPILLLVAVSLWKGVRPAVWLGWAVTTVLFFWWGAGVAQYLGAMGLALLTTVSILLIVLGAVFLFAVMSGTGLIAQIGRSLDALHPSAELRFFVLAIGLTAFFEGVAGFGTPGAIVPLILIAMGFGAVLSVSVVLLFDGLFAVFGAVGTPLLVGLQAPLGLPAESVHEIGVLAALLIGVSGLVVLWLVLRLFGQLHDRPVPWRQVVVLYGFFVVPFCGFAWLAPELATIFGALAMLVLSVLYLRQKGSVPDWRPWLPYVVLALVLLLPKLAHPLRQVLGWELVFADMFGSGLRGSIKLLQSPVIPFVAVGLGVALFSKTKTVPLKEPLQKMGAVFVVLFPSVVIAQLMVHSGGVRPSMVAHIAGLLTSLGPVYPVFAPFIGVIGAFITGSTTISNVVFGASQQDTAGLLGLSIEGVLALQLAGASLGNAVCLFNIIAAASVANLKDYKQVLANNLVPTLLAGLVVGLVGLGLV